MAKTFDFLTPLLTNIYHADVPKNHAEFENKEKNATVDTLAISEKRTIAYVWKCKEKDNEYGWFSENSDKGNFTTLNEALDDLTEYLKSESYIYSED